MFTDILPTQSSQPFWRTPISDVPGQNFLTTVHLDKYEQGSGGNILASNAGKHSYYPKNSRIREEREKPNIKINSRPIADQIQFIREVLAINMSDLADLLKVTRPTIYAWLEGRQEPKAESLLQISRIEIISAEIKKYAISRMDTFLHRPIFNNSSLLDKLKAGEDISKFLSDVKKLADKEAENRKKIKGSGKKLRSTADAIRKYSNPLYRE